MLIVSTLSSGLGLICGALHWRGGCHGPKGWKNIVGRSGLLRVLLEELSRRATSTRAVAAVTVVLAVERLVGVKATISEHSVVSIFVLRLGRTAVRLCSHYLCIAIGSALSALSFLYSLYDWVGSECFCRPRFEQIYTCIYIYIMKYMYKSSNSSCLC
jgi:hypothetical protein